MPRIDMTPEFERRFERKDHKEQGRISRAIDRLASGLIHQGLHVERMRSAPGIWSARIDDGNRMTFERSGDVILLRTNCRHDEVYRHP